MSEIFKKVMCSERMPENEGYYRTNHIEGSYFADGEWYGTKREYELLYPPDDVEWWLEPAEDVSMDKLRYVFYDFSNYSYENIARKLLHLYHVIKK